MNVKSIERKGNEATVVVEIDKELMESGVNKAYMKARKSIQLPGFRKGKAPRKMIEAMYGAHVFYEDGLEEIFPEIYDFAIAKQDFKAIGRPNLTDMQIGDDNIVTLTLTTEVYPEVTLGQYKGLEVEKEEVNVTDEQVQAELDRMAQNVASTETVERPAKMGDTANIDFEGFDNGVPFEGGKGDNFDLKLGSGQFVPGFEEQIVGMSAGEEKDIDITFPENYTKDLAGKQVVFHVKVNEVKEKQTPALDDEFAKDVSEFETLKELKDDTKAKITAEREQSAKIAFENALLEKVAGDIKADIPEVMIEEQCRRFLDEFKQRLQAQGIPYDQYCKMTNMDEAKFLEEGKEPATRQVRMDLAVNAIIKEEKLEATDEEVEKQYNDLAEKYSMDVNELKKYLDAMSVRTQIIRDKAISVVVDSAKIEKKKAPKKEAEGEAAEGEEKPAKKTAAKKSAKKEEEKAE